MMRVQALSYSCTRPYKLLVYEALLKVLVYAALSYQ